MSLRTPRYTARGRYIIAGIAQARRLLEGDIAVAKCPECDAEIDLDEEEVEEGELLSCPECEKGLEVVQTHPLRLDAISDDDDEADDDEEDLKSDDDDDDDDVKDAEEEDDHDETEDEAEPR